MKNTNITPKNVKSDVSEPKWPNHGDFFHLYIIGLETVFIEFFGKNINVPL